MIDNLVDTDSMITNQPNATYWDPGATAQLEDRLRELEANLERLAEHLNRLGHVQ